MVEKGGKEELTDESPVSPNTFWGAVASCFDKCFTPNGRASRAEIWYFSLFCQILSFISFLSIPLGFVLFFIFMPPLLMVKIRRLHDVNLSGWWILVWFTMIGAFPLVYFIYFKKGDVGENRFGADPYLGETDCQVGTNRPVKNLQGTQSLYEQVASERKTGNENISSGEQHKTEKPTMSMSSSHDDEQFYEQVAKEFNDGTIKQGLWLKAETKARGNQGEARALYTEWRVGQLAESESELREEAVRKQEEAAAVREQEEAEAVRKQVEADAIREQEEAEAMRKQVEAENKRKRMEVRAEKERSQRESERTGRALAIVFACGVLVFILLIVLTQSKNKGIEEAEGTGLSANAYTTSLSANAYTTSDGFLSLLFMDEQLVFVRTKAHTTFAKYEIEEGILSILGLRWNPVVDRGRVSPPDYNQPLQDYHFKIEAGGSKIFYENENVYLEANKPQ